MGAVRYTLLMANETARALRKRMTPQEVKLWVRLRALRQRGFHFRRQVPLEGHIVDFACLPSKLVVEVDGGQHGDDRRLRQDRDRDESLSRGGFRVLRVWNSEVDGNFEGVMSEILRLLTSD